MFQNELSQIEVWWKGSVSVDTASTYKSFSIQHIYITIEKIQSIVQSVMRSVQKKKDLAAH